MKRGAFFFGKGVFAPAHRSKQQTNGCARDVFGHPRRVSHHTFGRADVLLPGTRTVYTSCRGDPENVLARRSCT